MESEHPKGPQIDAYRIKLRDHSEIVIEGVLDGAPRGVNDGRLLIRRDGAIVAGYASGERVSFRKVRQAEFAEMMEATAKEVVAKHDRQLVEALKAK